MVNREQLKRGGLHAYELGRVLSAARTAWVLVPTALICALATGEGERCACLGLLLFGATVFLRWRDRRGVIAVRHGLLAGALPLVAGLLATRVAPSYCSGSIGALCTAVSVGIGLPSGLWLGIRLVRGAAPGSTWLAAGGIAILAASLGCPGPGIAALLGTTAGFILGAASARALVRNPT